MVVYAGAAGLVLPPTSGASKTKIKEAIDNLEAGGSTAVAPVSNWLIKPRKNIL
jgi:secreted protein with Ig-like and vWFA domain